MLAGEWPPERVALYDEETLADLRLSWRLGRRAVGFDAASRTVTLDDGERLTADGVVIATGARTRTLRDTESLAGVYTLRTLADSLAIRAEFDATPGRVVVVGAGFIGAEVAATARDRGLDVTMVEMAETPLERVLGAAMGRRADRTAVGARGAHTAPAYSLDTGGVCAEVHVDHGVDLRLGVGVESLSGTDRVEQVVLTDGTRLDADVVVVGVGVIPNTDWLEGSAPVVPAMAWRSPTAWCATRRWCLAAPGVVAAGDVARWPNRLFGESMRVEHWDNAIGQGTAAARRLLAGDGGGEPFAPVPWFWSDQYDRKIQLAGRSGPDDEVVVVTGSPDERRFRRRGLRAGRPHRRRARLQPSPPRHAVPPADRQGRLLGRRPGVRPLPGLTAAGTVTSPVHGWESAERSATGAGGSAAVGQWVSDRRRGSGFCVSGHQRGGNRSAGL